MEVVAEYAIHSNVTHTVESAILPRVGKPSGQIKRAECTNEDPSAVRNLSNLQE